MSQVLITGAGGFIPSHVVEAFLDAGRRVRALVHYDSGGSRGHLDSSLPALNAERDGRLEIVAGDITDPHQMLDICAGCDIIVHMAALIGIPYSYVAPASYVAVNTTGTLNILEAARRQRARRVIVTSTSEVYGTARTNPIGEDHPLAGQSPYAASKIGADKLAESYFCAFDLPVVVLRPFNTFGPRQSARAIVPSVMVQALGGEPAVRLGSLEPERDMTYATDTARAFVLAADASGIEGEVIHFGSGNARNIGEIARACLQALGSNAAIVSDADRVRPSKSEVGLLLCNPAKARRLLAWEPRISFEEGLRLTGDYLRGALNRYRVGEYTV